VRSDSANHGSAGQLIFKNNKCNYEEETTCFIILFIFSDDPDNDSDDQEVPELVIVDDKQGTLE
jgi:hypothetical protein